MSVKYIKLPPQVCVPPEVILDECGDSIKVNSVFIFKSAKAANNFKNNCENGDTKKLKAQFKRGTVKKIAV